MMLTLENTLGMALSRRKHGFESVGRTLVINELAGARISVRNKMSNNHVLDNLRNLSPRAAIILPPGLEPQDLVLL
jgi:hypothetical protein